MLGYGLSRSAGRVKRESFSSESGLAEEVEIFKHMENRIVLLLFRLRAVFFPNEERM